MTNNPTEELRNLERMILTRADSDILNLNISFGDFRQFLTQEATKARINELERCFNHDESLITHPNMTWIPSYYINGQIEALKATLDKEGGE